MDCQTTCPSDLQQLIMIEYPGFVKNPDKALDTLGGLDSIESVHESQKDRLELKFRKADPFSHPAYGDRVPKKCLVIRLTKTAKGTDSFTLGIVGKVQTSFKFETMAEFQWLPMQRLNASERIKSSDLQTGIVMKRSPESLNPSYTSVLDDVLPIKNPFDNSPKSFNPDAPLLIMPAVFSRFDTPRDIHQPHPKFRSKEMREEFERQQNLSIIGRTRKKRTTMSYLLNFNDQIPTKPPERLMKDRKMLTPQECEYIPKLKKLFERQKIWSKAALCFELNCQPVDIKYILPMVAFHYINGPFRTMWVQYGYDPHKDSSSKPLQTLDFRVKSLQEQHEYSRRCINQYQLPMRKNAEKLRKKQQKDLKSMIFGGYEDVDESSIGPKGFPVTEAMCKFRKDLVPTARQLSYHLKDIEISEVQEIIQSNDGKEPTECSEKDGWLVEGSIDRIRKLMNKCLNETFDKLTNQLET